MMEVECQQQLMGQHSGPARGCLQGVWGAASMRQSHQTPPQAVERYQCQLTWSECHGGVERQSFTVGGNLDPLAALPAAVELLRRGQGQLRQALRSSSRTAAGKGDQYK